MSANGKRRPLPPGWRWARLEEVGPLTDGDWILNSDYASSGVRLLQVGDVGLGEFVGKSSRFIPEDRATELNCTLLQPGDILISRMPEPIGRACMLPNLGYPCITAVDVTIWRPKANAANRSYLTYLLCSPNWFRRVRDLASGATRARISRRNLESLQIPLPSLDEQRCIAARLSLEMALVEKMRETARAQVEAAKALPAAFLCQVFESEEARRWPNKKLGDVCSLTDSGTWGLDPGGDVPTWPILRSNNIQDGEIVLNDVARRVVPAHVAAQKVLAPGDILVTKSSGSAALIGKCALVHTLPDEPHLFSNFTLRLRLNPKEAHPEFVLSYLHSPPARAVLAEIQNTTTGLRNLDLDRYLGQLLPLAPLGEQRRIAAELKAKLDIAETMRRSAQSQLEAVNALPAALLEGVFGEFEPPS